HDRKVLDYGVSLMDLSLHPTLKRYLTIAAKNAVFAVLSNAYVMSQWHYVFNFDNKAGLWAVVRLTVGTIGTREFIVWFPKLLKWSQTDADPNVTEALDRADVKNKEAGAAIQQAKDAESHKPGE